MVDSSPVSIDTINVRTPAPACSATTTSPSGAPIDTEMDGLTTGTHLHRVGHPERDQHDEARDRRRVGDDLVDSNVFIAAGSLTTSTAPGAPTDVSAIAGNTSATVSWDAPTSSGTTAIDSYQVTCTATGNSEIRAARARTAKRRHVSVGDGTNGTEYTCVVAAPQRRGGFGG